MKLVCSLNCCMPLVAWNTGWGVCTALAVSAAGVLVSAHTAVSAASGMHAYSGHQWICGESSAVCNRDRFSGIRGTAASWGEHVVRTKI
jgi:hypothetical protein